MPIKLAVPPGKASLDLTAETRPRQVKEWLEMLPLANPGDAARLLGEALDGLNRHPLDGDARLRLLELFHATLAQLTPALEQQFSAAPPPLGEKNRQLANLARQLHLDLANGYLTLLLECLNKTASASVSKQLPQILLHALQALNQVLVICYETYTPTPAGVWHEIHQLYHYARLNVFQDPALPEQGPPAAIGHTYKQALLLALSDPYRLMQGELATVMGYLERFASEARLQPLAPVDNPAGIFLVQPESDKPPRAVAHHGTAGNAATDLLLDTADLALALYQQWLAESGGPARPGQAGHADLLRRLLKQWEIAPKRAFSRSAKHASAKGCIGIPSLHQVLTQAAGGAAPEGTEPDGITITLHPPDSLPEKGSPVSKPIEWKVLNESAGGMRLGKHPAAAVQIRVGQAIGIRPPEATAWNIAVVRWVRSDNPEHLEFGAQMLSPSARPVTLKPTICSAGTDFEKALLLPEIPPLGQPATLLAGRGNYKPQREFLLAQNGEVSIIRASRLLEQTASFDLFDFTGG